MLRSVALVTFIVMPTAAVFAEGTSRFPERRGAVQPKLPPCECRAEGRRWGEGQQVCLDLTGKRRMYVCAVQQNVTTWMETNPTCPDS
ncbi:MAG TPA: hypothetical protein PLQ11_07555 [Beijerinckiaceae bacterium]|nr:hypothetical protein [Beijerinckiaceae bacterium]